MVKNYNEWLSNVLLEDNPDLYVLDSLHGAIVQYLGSPNSVACIGVLDRALECTAKYLAERNKVDAMGNG